jgi:inosine-uridine nucleoside N-ribohydrolase
VRRIWIDTDVALGADRGDVDDGFAIAAVIAKAFLAPREIEVLGISAVTGNTHGAIAHRAAKDLVRVFGAEVPVVTEAEAPEAIAHLPEGASLLMIGPPTNVVRAAKIDPALPSRIEVRGVGTVIDRRRHPILARFCLNFRRDPEATRAFFALDFRERALFPLDVVRALRFGPNELREIAAIDARCTYLSQASERWLASAPLRYVSRSFPVWDLVAALDAIDELPGATKEGSKLVRFDAARAYRRFIELLSRSARVDSTSGQQ